MVEFPDDFWDALTAGNTSDWLFWVDIAIIVLVLFVLLCFARCCMWCFNSKKNDEKFVSNAEDAKAPPAWLSHQQSNQPSGLPYYQPPQVGALTPHNQQQIPSAWGQPSQPPPPYNYNPHFNLHAQPGPPQLQHSQGAPLYAHPSTNSPDAPNGPNGQYSVKPVPAPAPQHKERQPHQSSVRWTKEDFESVFSDKVSVDIMQGSSSPGAERPDQPPQLQRTPAASSKPLPAWGASKQGRGGCSARPGHAHASPHNYTSDSPSRGDSPASRDSPSHRRSGMPPHTPTLPFSPTTKSSAGERDSPQRVTGGEGAGFHTNEEGMLMHRAHASTPEHQSSLRTPSGIGSGMGSGMGSTAPPPVSHMPSPSMHSTRGSGTPRGSIPSKMYNTTTPTSPSDYTPSDTEGGVPGRDAIHGRNGSFTSGGHNRRGSIPKLQPPLPVSPRVATLLDNALLNNNTVGSEAPPILPDVGPGMGAIRQEQTAAPPQQTRGKAGGAGIGNRAGSAPPSKSPQEHPGRAIRMQKEALAMLNAQADDTGEVSKGFEMPRAVDPTTYAAMYEHALRSKKSGGLSASQSQGFHLEAELMLVGGGPGDSDGSILEGRDLAQVSMDTQTVAVVECPENATLTEFLGLTRQRHVKAQFVDKNASNSGRAMAVWDLGVRFFKLRRRDEAQFAVMRRLHRLPNSPEARFWKQGIDIDFEADSFHPALGHRMTVSGAEEVIFVEIANQSGMWLELRLPPQPPPGVMHERWVKLVMQEGSVVCLPKGCTYMLGMPENGMVGLLRARMAASAL